MADKDSDFQLAPRHLDQSGASVLYRKDVFARFWFL